MTMVVRTCGRVLLILAVTVTSLFNLLFLLKISTPSSTGDVSTLREREMFRQYMGYAHLELHSTTSQERSISENNNTQTSMIDRHGVPHDNVSSRSESIGGKHISQVRMGDRAGVQQNNVSSRSEIRRPGSDLHKHDYALLANAPNTCLDAKGQPEPVYLLILMTSAHHRIKQRTTQRETCLSLSKKTNKTIRTVFVLGSMPYFYHPEWIQDEISEHRDVVIADFRDSYRNLTIKTMTALKWAVRYCPLATWVMKVDDDVFFNLFNVVEELDRFSRPRNLIVGSIISDPTPVRKKSSKWYISREDYPGDTYPEYPCGICYILSGDLPSRVVEEAGNLPYIFLEDVFVGGILAERLNVQLYDSQRIIRSSSKPPFCFMRDKAAVHLGFNSNPHLEAIWLEQEEYFATGNASCTD